MFKVSEVDINLILQLVIVLLGLLTAILGKKWHSAVKVTKKIPLIRKVFEEGADIFKRLEQVQDFSELEKQELIDLLRETQEFIQSIKQAWQDP